MTNKLFLVVVLALAVSVSACEGKNPAGPSTPNPGPSVNIVVNDPGVTVMEASISNGAGKDTSIGMRIRVDLKAVRFSDKGFVCSGFSHNTANLGGGGRSCGLISGGDMGFYPVSGTYNPNPPPPNSGEYYEYFYAVVTDFGTDEWGFPSPSSVVTGHIRPELILARVIVKMP
jgi:hypothetical protein